MITTLVEKYRPRTFDEMVGNELVIEKVRNMIKRKKEKNERLPNIMFIGPTGCGKTTLAHVIGREWFGHEYHRFFIELNSSDDRKIDTVRTKIKYYTELRDPFIILLDEADNMGKDAQQALRRMMERAKNVTFMFTGNNVGGFHDAIKSRCVIYEFEPLSDEQVAAKLWEIIEKEGYQFDVSNEELVESFIEYVKYFSGDLRAAINSLEKVVVDGAITVGSLGTVKTMSFSVLALEAALNGDFLQARDYIEDALINHKREMVGNGFSVEYLLRKSILDLYEAIKEKVADPRLQAWLLVKLAEVEDRLKKGRDPLIQLTSFLALAWRLSQVPSEHLAGIL